MTYKFKIGVMFFNEATSIPGLLSNLMSFGVNAQDVVFFDGPFIGFPTKDVMSSDGSRDLITNWGAELIDCGAGTHLEKQNIRFKEMGERCDVLFKMDCDDRVYGDWQAFKGIAESIITKTDRAMFNVPWFDLDGSYSQRSWSPRIFLGPGQFEVRVGHWMFFIGEKRAQATHSIGGIQMFHESSLRSPKREKEMGIYQKYQMEHEAKDIAKWQLKEESFNDIIIKRVNGGLDITKPFRKHDCGCQYGYVMYKTDKSEIRLHDVTKICGRHMVHEIKP